MFHCNRFHSKSSHEFPSNFRISIFLCRQSRRGNCCGSPYPEHEQNFQNPTKFFFNFNFLKKITITVLLTEMCYGNKTLIFGCDRFRKILWFHSDSFLIRMNGYLGRILSSIDMDDTAIILETIKGSLCDNRYSVNNSASSPQVLAEVRKDPRHHWILNLNFESPCLLIVKHNSSSLCL